jgi:hypothetical protein
MMSAEPIRMPICLARKSPTSGTRRIARKDSVDELDGDKCPTC